MPEIDVLASNADQTRRVRSDKAKYGGRDWQTTTLRGKPRGKPNETFRVLGAGPGARLTDI